MINASKIADFLGKPLLGAETQIESVKSLDDYDSFSLVWLKDVNTDVESLLRKKHPALIICCQNAYSCLSFLTCIVVDNPRLAIAKVLNEFFVRPPNFSISPKSQVSSKARIGKNALIEPFAVIDDDVIIGDNVIIGSGVKITGKTIIGNRCIIKPNAVIGEWGFGFLRDGNEVIHFPHIGGVVIGDDVCIGSCSTIERGGLGNTIIGNQCKVDDLVQVGHNCKVGDSTFIMSNVTLCGGVQIGSKCWIAPNSVIKEKIKVGNGVTVGLGAVVINDVCDGLIVAGVPAETILKG